MSYDISFFKREDLSLDEINEVLESEARDADDFYISKELIFDFKKSLEEKKLQFDFVDIEDGAEFNFSTFQIVLSNSEIVISILYYVENLSDEINEILSKILHTLQEFGMSGYDPQTEFIYSNNRDFLETFSKSKKLFSDLMGKYTDNNKPKKKWWNLF